MTAFNRDTVKKMGILAGLVFFGVCGLVRLPEVALHFYPDQFWETQIQNTKKELIRCQMHQHHLDATIDALNHAREYGFPQLEGLAPPNLSGIKMALKRCQAQMLSRRENTLELQELLLRFNNLKAGGQGIH
jgi:hypothetical protein